MNVAVVLDGRRYDLSPDLIDLLLIPSWRGVSVESVPGAFSLRSLANLASCAWKFTLLRAGSDRVFTSHRQTPQLVALAKVWSSYGDDHRRRDCRVARGDD